MPERDVPTEESEIGTVRIAEVLAAHPSYERLKALRAEERTLTLLLRDLPKTPEIKPPETDPAPFEDSVWQKNAQVVISTRVELEREQKRLAEVYRKQTQADYEARKKAIDDEYLNAILNINLKIDNQRAMHGPQVSEEELARERAMWEGQRALLKASGKRAAAPLRQPGRASLRRQAESKTGANSEGSKCRFAQFPLGHHAMDRGAKKCHPSTAHGPARNAARAPDSRLMRKSLAQASALFLPLAARL